MPVRTKRRTAQTIDHQGVRARILMVDDHQPNLLALEAILAPLGEEMVGVTSGEDALRELLDGEFALILMDVQMPGIDGIETAALIRQREKNRSTPIIFLTAIAKDPSFIFKGYSQGAVDYLLKPFDPEILRTKVSVFVDLWRKGELIKRQAAMLRAQEMLELERRSEVRFHALTDSMPQCVWAADRDGEVHYCNRVWREYAGSGAGTSFFGAVPEDELLAVRNAWATAIRAGHPMEREQRLRRHDGEVRWHLFRVVPEYTADGAIAGWIATATEIDHQKRVEEAHASLLVREQEARAQLETASRAKDEFLATVSHELRTPLNAILGWTRMLRSGAVPTGPQLERALETIERNARAQTQLIEDMLDVSRIIAGKLRVQVRRIDLRDVISSAVEAVRPAADAKQLNLALELGGMHFGAVGRGEQATDFIGRAVDLRAALGRGAVEEVDQAPGDFLGILLERGIGKQSQKVGPDAAKRLVDGIAVRELGRTTRLGAFDCEMAELELGKLSGKACVHDHVSRESRRPSAALPEPDDPAQAASPAPRRSRGKPPAEAGAGSPTRSWATRAERRRVAGMRRRVRASPGPLQGEQSEGDDAALPERNRDRQPPMRRPNVGNPTN